MRICRRGDAVPPAQDATGIGMPFKIQDRTPPNGPWANLTRAPEVLSQATAMLDGYNRDYPSREHRLVMVEIVSGQERYTAVRRRRTCGAISGRIEP
jgi:hypothetical protein